jgi:hypothetical protein
MSLSPAIAVIGMLSVASAPAALQSSLDDALRVPGARLELLTWDSPTNCQGEFQASPVERSGRVAVRVRGQGCDGWGWATVRLWVSAAVSTRDVPAGGSLDGAWALNEVELRQGREVLHAVPEGTTASRGLRAGTTLLREALRLGPPPGTTVRVRLVVGGLALEQQGTISAARDGVCAQLPSGRHLCGVLREGILTVSSPVIDDGARTATWGGRP